MKAHLRVALVCGALAFTHGASAQQPTASDKAAAERLFNDGKSLMQRKDYDGACQKFAESLRMENGIGVMLHLAACYEKQGKMATAWAQFREAASLADKQGDERAAIARRRADALESTLSDVTIVVPEAAQTAGLQVMRDGSVVGRAQWGTAIPLDAGVHVVSATAPNRAPWETTVHLAGDHAHVSVSVPALVELAPPAPTAPAPSTPPVATARREPETPVVTSRGISTREVVGLAIAGVGLVGLGFGTYFGLHSRSLLDDSNASGHCRPDNHCDAIGGQARNDALSAATVSNISFAVGLVAIAGGAVLYFSAPKGKAPSVAISAQIAGKDGAFVMGRASF